MGCIESSGSLACFASILSYSPSPPPLFPPSPFFIAVIRFQPPPFGEKGEKKKGLRHRRKTSSPRAWWMRFHFFLSLSSVPSSTRNRRFSIRSLASNYFSRWKFLPDRSPLYRVPISTRHMSVRFTDVRPWSTQTSLRSLLRQPFPTSESQIYSTRFSRFYSLACSPLY